MREVSLWPQFEHEAAPVFNRASSGPYPPRARIASARRLRGIKAPDAFVWSLSLE
ncbi:MAG: hypothetical protein JNK72_09405 [Myxococcales bacterium]|nr:hypothetical protein [Myxococcales bacterium]